MKFSFARKYLGCLNHMIIAHTRVPETQVSLVSINDTRLTCVEIPSNPFELAKHQPLESNMQYALSY